MFDLFKATTITSLHAAEEAMKSAPSLMATVQSTVGGMMGSVMGMFGTKAPAAKTTVTHLSKMAQQGVLGTVGAFGLMKSADQKAIAKMGENVNNVLVTVLKREWSFRCLGKRPA
jgi:hypothetical protein